MAPGDPDAFIESFRGFTRCVKGVIAQSYAELGVGSTQAKFLRHIGRSGRMSQAELARATETDPTLTGRALETLIDRGWVRRRRSEADRRQYVLELSAAGRRACEQVEAARARVIQRVVGVLSPRDLADFERITRKLREAFEDSESIPARPA